MFLDWEAQAGYGILEGFSSIDIHVIWGFLLIVLAALTMSARVNSGQGNKALWNSFKENWRFLLPT